MTEAEGLIHGIGTKMFTIAGPVIVYGVSASVVYGLIYYLARRTSDGKATQFAYAGGIQRNGGL